MGVDGGFTERVGIDVPIVQAPMIGPSLELATLVSEAGGLGSLACAAMGVEQVAAAVAALRRRTGRPFNLNFFCHAPAPVDEASGSGDFSPLWAGRGAGLAREVGAAALTRALAEGASPAR